MKYKNKRRNKNYDTIFIICLIPILLFISISLSNVNRNYFFIEKIIKKGNYYINKVFLKKQCTYNDNSKALKIYINKLEKDNNELRNVLKIKNSHKKIIVCDVFNKHNLIISKKVEASCSSKLKTNSYVFNNYGLVGYVSKSSKKISQIKLLTNLDKPISVIIKSNEKEIFGVLKKYDKKNDYFIVSNVISKELIKENDEVVLYDDKSIIVGRVIDIENDNYGLSKNIIVKSDVNFYDINLLYQIGDE